MEEMNVTANVEEVVTPQDSVETTETTETTQTTETKPEVTETQAFARRLKEEKQKAIDAEYDRLYGAEYGIHSKAEYDAAIAKQQEEQQRQKFQEENGIDPDAIKPLFQQWKESDPDFQELKAIRAEKNSMKALTDLNNELKDAGVDLQIKDLSNEELNKVPNIDKVLEHVQKGHSLADAFFLANKKDIISRQAQTAQQEAIKKIAANGASSPGSLSEGGETLHFTKEQVDAMTQDQVMKNYPAIMKSMKNWK